MSEEPGGPRASRKPLDRDILAATVASAAMIAQQVAGKSTRDALFLSEFHARALPGMMILAAIVSFTAALLAARLLARNGPRDVVRGAFLLNAAAFGVEFVVSFFSRASIAVAVYVHLALFGATVISLFWSLINERWDPHAAKSAISTIAAGGTLGGVIGGLVGWRLSQLTSVRMMLLALAASNVMSLLAVARVGRGRPSRPSHPASSWPPVSPPAPRGVPALRAESYLLTLGAMVAIVATMDALLDYMFAAEAAVRLTTSRELMTFFSVFHTAVAIATFVAQATLSRRVLERFGLAVTLAVLPVALVMLALIGLQTHALIAIVLLRGTGAVFANSLWRSGYELLYTPIAQSKKRSTKTLIDVGCDRLGTLVGSALVLAVLATSNEPRTRMLFLVVALGVVTIVAAQALHRGYVDALEASLRIGAVSVEERAVSDATAQRTAADRDRVELALEVSVEAPPPSSGRSPGHREARDGLVDAVADLRSGHRLRIQRVLCAGDDAPPLASFVIPLLAREDTRAEALAWLRRLAPRIEGQLVDAVRDRTLDPAARRRLPRLLRGLATQAAADGLARALCDERFDIRYECGAALARLAEREPSIHIPSRAVLDAVRLELAVERRLLEAEPVQDLEDEPEAPIFRGELRDRATRGLEHVFTILSLMLDREALRIAWRALQSDDKALRGTALEYLDNVLPSEIRDALWPYIERARRPLARPGADEPLIPSFPPTRPSLA